MSIELHHGDCLGVLRTMPDASVDAVVTDPPYGLGKAPNALAMLRDWLDTGHHDVRGSGFMGKAWDAFVPQPVLWREVARVMKPGAHLVAFAGTRTQDLMGLALRMAGLELRDVLAWMYGSGFPKSLDVGKAIDKKAGAERQVVGRATGRAATPKHDIRGGRYADGTSRTIDLSAVTAPATDAARQWEGWGTALKPAYEPAFLARKPLVGTVATNVQAHGTGALNIEACRIGNSKRVPGSLSKTHGTIYGGGSGIPVTKRTLDDSGHNPNIGRWPANVVLDEAAAAMLDEQSGDAKPKAGRAGLKGGSGFGAFNDEKTASTFGVWPSDPGGGASRFFYTSKAGREDRELEDGTRSNHPTVKPVDLMRWLVRLVTPPGGVVLDPFMGSGSTGVVCVHERFRFIGIEREAEYVAIARARLDAATRQGLLDL